jgi:homoaconitase
LEAAAAAKAAAARISAQLQAGKGIQHVDVPPIRTPKAVASPPVLPSPSSKKGIAVVGEAYQQDGDYIQDIEINDLRNRYTLTKGAVQKKVNYSVVLLIGSGSSSSLCIRPHALLPHR